MKKRKVIQIAACENGDGNPAVIVLCDDGTLWDGLWTKGGYTFCEIPVDKIEEKA